MIGSLLAPFVPYIAAGAVVISAGGAFYIQHLTGRIDALKHENARLTGQVLTCNARVGNILEDKESDATVSDPGDFDVPDGWLMPSPRGASD